MTTKAWIVGALLHLYPAAWRREYGAELSDLLLSQPLRTRGVIDVVLSGLGQRARTADPWTILGTAAMVYIIAELVWGLPGAPPGRSHGLTGLVRPSGITFPTYKVTPMLTDLYALVLMVCGAWTDWRHPSTLSRAGLAAVKTTLLAGSPIVIAGLLSITGVRTGPPSVLEIITAPIFMLPQHWLYGYLGGALGRRLRSFTRWITQRLALSS